MKLTKLLFSGTFLILIAILSIIQPTTVHAQAAEEAKEDPSEAKSLAIYLNDEKSKYLWINMLGQTEVNLRDNQPKFSIKRTQLFLNAKVSNRIMLSMYLTTNSIDANKLVSNAQGTNNQISLNGLYLDADIIPGKFRLGAGLHYVNGISRLTNYSSFTSMTYDAPGGAFLGDAFYPAWWGYGYSDQFSSPLGIYAIGDIEKFHYQISINNSMVNNYASDYGGNTVTPDFTYQGNYFFQQINSGKAAMNYAGYFEYQFLDTEWHDFTFRRGTYMGSKKVFNLGAGFFHQPNALIRADSMIVNPTETDLKENVSTAAATTLAIDAFYDAPLGDGAINAYAAFHFNDFGEKGAVFGSGSGTVVILQLGYVLPVTIGTRTKMMPYVAYSSQSYDHTPNGSYEGSIGYNIFIQGHKLKLTPEYIFGKKGADGAENNGFFRMLMTMSL